MRLRLFVAAVGGIAVLGLGPAGAQQIEGDAQPLTLAGAKVMLTEIEGMDACEEVTPPAIPDGSTATETELKAAIAQFQTYMAKADDYRDCLNNVALKHRGKLTAEQDSAITMVYDSNAEEVERLGAKINAEIKAFNAAHSQ